MIFFRRSAEWIKHVSRSHVWVRVKTKKYPGGSMLVAQPLTTTWKPCFLVMSAENRQTQTPEIYGIPWIQVVTFRECSGCWCTKRWSKKKMACPFFSRSTHQSLPSLFLAAYGVSLGNVQQMASFTHLHLKETLVNYYIHIYIVGILHGI